MRGRLVVYDSIFIFFFFSSRRRHTRLTCDWGSDVCSSDLQMAGASPAFRRETQDMNVTVRALGPVRSLPREGKPDRAEVEAAVRTLIRWSGDDPLRNGLLETPARVTRALEEAFAGYAQDPAAILQKSFDEIEGYDEMVVLRGIRFESHCEHHMSPILGHAWVAYVPDSRVVGISKLARVVEAYAKRLQIQEKLTAQIANTVNDVDRKSTRLNSSHMSISYAVFC